jgi:uncharacterized protein YabN with tetrapyrrole methylase and pyrophosphatase domain
MTEEAGDLVLQSVFHGDIARRSGEFDTADIIDGLCKKLVTRHTHVFGNDVAGNAAEALSNWEKAKAKEKNHFGLADKLAAIPNNFPACMRTQKAVKYARGAGLQVEEENLKTLLKSAADGNEIGRALLLTVALAVITGKNAEDELYKTADKFLEICTKSENIKALRLDETL